MLMFYLPRFPCLFIVISLLTSRFLLALSLGDILQVCFASETCTYVNFLVHIQGWMCYQVDVNRESSAVLRMFCQ